MEYQTRTIWQKERLEDTMAALAVQAYSAKTSIDGKVEYGMAFMGDCPCPCPPIAREIVYVSFSPIF